MSMQAEVGPLLRQSASHLDPLPATHPLSVKLRTVFDSTSSFSSQPDATRRALQDIEERYAVPEGQTGRARGLPFDAGVTAKVDTEKARSLLARDAQDALEDACFGFLDSLQVVDKSLSAISDAMSELHESCSEIEKQLGQADASTRYLLQHADGLRKQRNLTAQQSVLLDLFLTRFSLTSAQLDAIESHSEAVGPPLFAAMDRLQEIRSDCRVLLVGQEEGTKAGMRAGMDIMDETAQLVEKSHQKIAKWLHFEMRSFFRESMDVGGNVREAVKRLDRREDLLRPVLKTLAATRAQQLSTSFQRALTIGGPAPTFLPRPMELHAHDPIRYVGDMLAWVHQSVASEREFLSGLFSRIGHEPDAEGGRRVGERRRGLEGSIDWTKNTEAGSGAGLTKAELWTREVLNKVMEGCDRLLKVRIEQTVRSQEGCITTFRLASLIQFYRVTMDRTIGSRATLSKTLAAISVFAYQAFLATLDRLAAGLSRFQQSPESDLAPPPPLLGTCATLKELLNVHQTSLSESDLFGDLLPLKDLDSSDESTDFSLVIQRLVTPMVALCSRMSNDIVQKRPRGKKEQEAEWEKEVFMINCLGYVQSLLEPYEFAARSVRQVEADLETRLAILIDAHYKSLSLESGISRVGETAADVGKMFEAFEAFLSSPLLLGPPRLGLLSAPARRSAVHANALARVADDYEALVKREQDSSKALVARKSPQEIRILLGLDGKHGG